MSPLAVSHAVWLMRRAAVVGGTSADVGPEPADGVRAQMLLRVSTKVAEAAEGGTEFDLTPAERTLLVTEAHDLAARAAKELKRAGDRDLRHAEEWVMMARVFREIVEASRADT